MCWFPVAAMVKYPKQGLKGEKFPPSEGSRGRCFQASPSFWLSQPCDPWVPCFAAVSLQLLPLLSHDLHPVCLCDPPLVLTRTPAIVEKLLIR